MACQLWKHINLEPKSMHIGCIGVGEGKHINLSLLPVAGTKMAVENQLPFFQKLGFGKGTKKSVLYHSRHQLG